MMAKLETGDMLWSANWTAWVDPCASCWILSTVLTAGTSFPSLGDPLWDTGSGSSLLTVIVIAELERAYPQRAREGRRRAMANGVKLCQSQSYRPSIGRKHPTAGLNANRRPR
jgi:hypothetical protein